MAEQHKHYRQRELYQRNTEQAAPRRWAQRIAYAVLPAVASLYINGCATELEADAEKKEEASKVILKIERRDGTIEEIVVNRDDVIMCTEEDIFGKKRQNQPK